MKPRNRLQQLRETSLKTREDLASSIGISVEHYCDLEDQDGELYTTLSLHELRKLTMTLGTSIRVLFGIKGEAIIDFEGIAEALRRHLVKEHLSVDEFGNKVGWNLQNFIDGPDIAGEWNVDCLCDVCRGLGISWLDALP
jgi:DNA-binding XRE family transcriptional regulator